MKGIVYNAEGKDVGSIELPDILFGVKKNDMLLRQVVLGLKANQRAPYAHTKGRGDVRGGGKKPWKQKGTGRARHGSIRSPIWRGGGTTHGPLKERSYEQKINRRMSAQAVATVLSEKNRLGKVVFVDTLSFVAPKTAEAKTFFANLSKVKDLTELGTRRKNAALLLTSGHNSNLSKSFRNMGNVSVSEARSANALDLMTYRYVVLIDPEKSIQSLVSRLEK